MKKFASIVVLLLLAGRVLSAQESSPVTLVKDGKAVLPLFAGSVAPPIEELRHYLKKMSGADFKVQKPAPGQAGLYVGTAADFPVAPVERVQDLGPEGFILKSDGRSVYLIAAAAPGVPHAVTTFLQSLGCRWFFPGKTWEVIPAQATLAGTWHERQTPSFATQRTIWYGFGADPKNKREFEEWNRHNRMGGPLEVSIGHSWIGLNAERDFAAHPDWFALVDGKRKASKPCYSNPEVIKIATEHALHEGAAGKRMISLTPPDGLGYCECERCRQVFQGGQPEKSHGTIFAKRPDGVLVNIVSENLFHLVNEVAKTVSAKYPRAMVGCYLYSAYSHPPSFKLEPNVFVQTTTAYRRTPLSLEEELTILGKLTPQVGIREYYSVYQWDWDGPYPGQVTPTRLENRLKLFRDHNVTSVNAEASDNWGPRGLGYYVAAQLLWNVRADVPALVRDFYAKAFGPAAQPLERYYARWYGASVKTSNEAPAGELDEKQKGGVPLPELQAAYRDLDEAARLVQDLPGPRARVDDLRMYVHYLILRNQVERVQRSHDEQAILKAVEAETLFAARLAPTGLIHSRALLGKAYLRRFSLEKSLLAKVPEAQSPGKGWRRESTPPDHEELDQLWAADRALLKIP